MRILEGKELDDALKQMQEWEAKKAKAIEDAFQRGIAQVKILLLYYGLIQIVISDGNYLQTLLRRANYLMKPLIKDWL